MMATNRLPLTSLFRAKAVRTAIPSEVVPTSGISVGPKLKRGGSYIDARVVHSSIEREKVRAWRLVTSNNRQCSTTRCLALDHVEAGRYLDLLWYKKLHVEVSTRIPRGNLQSNKQCRRAPQRDGHPGMQSFVACQYARSTKPNPEHDECGSHR